jgi:hypothetical protein
MNTKHTDGKWLSVQHSQFSNGTEIVCNGKVITAIFNQRATDIEGKANARLMAAAPELLQMVYDLMNCIKRLTDSDLELHQEDKDKEAQWIGEAHELLHVINPDYYNNANKKSN